MLQEAAGSAAASLAPCPGSAARTSKPSQFVDVGGTLFFTADDGAHGQELWKSDGTKAGTVLVRDINPGGRTGSNPASLTAMRGRLFFNANDGTHGRELWRSDGTKAGTVLVKNTAPSTGDGDGPAHLTAVDGKLFFTADPGRHGKKLWKSNGTKAGTVMVKHINRGHGGLYASYLTAVGGELFFIDEDTHGQELWKSNGTKAGTVLVKNMNPGGMSNDYDYGPTTLTGVGRRLFFIDDDDTHGQELWTSNGSSEGTVLVKDINTAVNHYDGGSLALSSNLSSLTALGGTLFFAADDNTHGHELWKSNGSGSGTVMVKDIKPGNDSSLSSFLTAVGGTLFFTAQDGVHGQELWKSGGSSAGTVLVKDINPGHGSAASSLTAVGGTLFFTADDGVHGQELWTSNGSGSGTVLVKDIRACSGEFRRPSSPDRGGETVVLRRKRRHSRPGAVEVGRHQGGHRPRQGHQRGPYRESSCAMSRRQRCAKKRVVRARVSQAKLLRRRARGAGATRAATAAAAAVDPGRRRGHFGLPDSKRKGRDAPCGGRECLFFAGAVPRPTHPLERAVRPRRSRGNAVLHRRRRHPRPGAVEVGRHQRRHGPRQGHQTGY